MIKKIVLIFVLIFSLFVWSSVFAWDGDVYYNPELWVYDSKPSEWAVKVWDKVDNTAWREYKEALDAANRGETIDKTNNWTTEKATDWNIATERWVSADWTMINPWDKIEGKDDKKEGWDSKWWSDWGWWGIWWWGWPDDISSKDFEIDTSLFSIGWSSLKWWDSKTTINNTLWNVIKKLMIALWVISLFVMTVWAWYMIMYHWHDEYLSKWKNIFIWWITALIVALSSYYLVNLVWYILYS